MPLWPLWWSRAVVCGVEMRELGETRHAKPVQRLDD